jgi:glutaredoxin 3
MSAIIPNVIEIYGTPTCIYCRKAKELCSASGYHHVYHDIAGDLDRRAELFARVPHARTVPQIFVGARHIGGFDDLFAAHVAGEIQQMLGGQ